MTTIPPSLESFEAHRPLMFSIAYRMLGSAVAAEDIVQEAYLRYQTIPPETIRSPKALLAKIVTRLSLNQLESARMKRVMYTGDWLPEPILTEPEGGVGFPAPPTSPADQRELYESISLAFLVLLEQLTPLERAVFLLREVFDYDYDEIAAILEKTPVACRQLFSRAKKHVGQKRPRFRPEPGQHEQLLAQFMAVVGSGDMAGLTALLADDVIMWADGGGKVRGAATRSLHGPTHVAQFVLASTRFLPTPFQVDVRQVNGQPAAVVRVGGQARLVIALEISQDRINTIRVIGNPDKLQWV